MDSLHDVPIAGCSTGMITIWKGVPVRKVPVDDQINKRFNMFILLNLSLNI